VSDAAGLRWISRPRAPLRGELRVPGDKSISHRAMLLGSLAEGTSEVSGFLEGEDTLATAAAFRAMGVRIDAPAPGRRIVHGVGLHGLHAPSAPIDCGNAGTGMRLLTGVLAAQRFGSQLVGDASLSRRPMRRVIEPLAAMRARIRSTREGTAPLEVLPVPDGLRGVDYVCPVASAQVKSAVLLAGLYARGATRVAEPHPTRDHTERMLEAFGWPTGLGDGWITVAGGARLAATRIEVPADFSSAAFFVVAASLIEGSDVVLIGVGINRLRCGLLEVLRRMGADIAIEHRRLLGGEPVADLRVRHAKLRGIDVPTQLVPDMIDEFPALFVAAACADGTTIVSGAHELRVKESDRIAVMARGLGSLGITLEERPDGAVIHGGRLRGGLVDSAGDHRCAMSFAVAGAVAGGPVEVADCANVATSFPGFVELACRAGMDVSVAATPGPA
jgi:3-phosphoshikimate 1-carboxyvinyltransferase